MATLSLSSENMMKSVPKSCTDFKSLKSFFSEYRRYLKSNDLDATQKTFDEFSSIYDVVYNNSNIYNLKIDDDVFDIEDIINDTKQK